MLATLKAIRALIAKPESWTQGANARDADGYSVAATSNKAVCWCLSGAFSKESAHDTGARDALDLKPGKMIIFNDNHTHAEVLAMLDRSIKRALC